MSTKPVPPPDCAYSPEVVSAVLEEFSTAAGKRHSGRVSLASDYRNDLGIDSIGLISAICALEARLGVSLVEDISELAVRTTLTDVAATVQRAVARS